MFVVARSLLYPHPVEGKEGEGAVSAAVVE